MSRCGRGGRGGGWACSPEPEIIKINACRTGRSLAVDLDIDFADVRHGITRTVSVGRTIRGRHSDTRAKSGNRYGYRLPSGGSNRERIGCRRISPDGINRAGEGLGRSSARIIIQNQSQCNGGTGGHINVKLHVGEISQIHGLSGTVLRPVPTDSGVIRIRGPAIRNVHAVGPRVGCGSIFHDGGV